VIANVIDSPVDSIAVGSSVIVTFEAVSSELTVPQFTLAEFTGRECTSCHSVLVQELERCPICQAANSFVERRLGSSGQLYSYSIVRTAPRGFTAPYVVAYVDMPEGPRVFGHLDLEASGETDLDRPVEPYLGSIGQGPDGEPMTGVRFRLIATERGGS
jgi:uncharacterized OB-fold protein